MSWPLAIPARGCPTTPNDPYIFTGLNPGVYYIGVSAQGTLRGRLGYDPVNGTSGTAGLAQAGGSYDLQVVADPADSLTQVLGFSLQKADALDPIPTGMTLSFSGTIDPNSLSSSSPILVRDASGNTWPVTLSGYEGSQVSFAFEQPLPPGQYTVVDPPSGGLTDLTGRAPVSPGQNPGVLATFTVEPQTSQPVAGNLGVLWPNTQYQVSQSATILPGQEVVSRVVVLATGFYTLETTFTQGSVEILRAGPDGVADIGTASIGPSNSHPMHLEAGVYLVSFRTVGEQPAVGQWTFQFSSIDHESIMNNGVGQGGALSLRLINPMTSSSTSGSPRARARCSRERRADRSALLAPVRIQYRPRRCTGGQRGSLCSNGRLGDSDEPDGHGKHGITRNAHLAKRDSRGCGTRGCRRFDRPGQ